MGFFYHKYTVAILCAVEIGILLFLSETLLYRFHWIMGVIYFFVTFWFVFGDCEWWLYQSAGILCVVIIMLFKISAVAYGVNLLLWSHGVLAVLWGSVLLIHLFVEKNLGPPNCPPLPRNDARRYPE